jgi:predicted MPP superfamily phosphohydrolase
LNVFRIIAGLIALYVMWRYVWPLPWHWAAKALLAVVLLFVALHHLVLRTFFGSLAAPEVPTMVLVVLGWAFGTFILLAMLLLARDLIGVVTYPFSRNLGRMVLSGPGLLYGLGIAAMLLSAAGVWQAMRVPAIKTIEISLERLPSEFDGFRVVQLTDLHASRLLRAPWTAAVVAKANALEPDLIVITGDVVDGTPQARAADVGPLKDLTAGEGVFGVPGNHEYYVDYVGWLAAFRQLDLRMLLNEHVVITRGGGRLVLAGITDATASAFGQARPDVAGALAGAPPGAPVILLSHRPTGAVRNAQAGVDLQLSGHTHGGQILGAHVLVQWFNEGFVSGLYRVGAMQLYLSKGTGLWSGFPVRLGRPSEITQIVLRSGAPMQR